jgi:hypothetical protein
MATCLATADVGDVDPMNEVNLSRLLRMLEQEQLRSAELDLRKDYWLIIYQSKRQILVDLATNRLTLLEAAARFRVLNSARTPYMLEFARGRFGPCSEDEAFCREVIASFRMFDLTDLGDPGRLNAIQARLEAELRQHREKGSLHLPTVRRSKGEG